MKFRDYPCPRLVVDEDISPGDSVQEGGHFKLAEQYINEGLTIQQYHSENSVRLSCGLQKLAELYIKV